MKLFCNLDKKTIIITESQRKKIQEMIAYHGSKMNFDEFNLAYMGTGVGAQEFGEGIYLTFDKEAAYGYGGTVYTVNIPDENKANYIYYDRPIPSDLFSSIIDNIITDITRQYPNEYTDEQSIDDLRKELYDIMDPSEGRHLMYNIHRYIDDSIVIPKILKNAGVTGFIYNNGKVNNVIMFSSRDIKILDKETVNENKNYINETIKKINQCINEEYGINDELILVANRLGNDIRNEIQKVPTENTEEEGLKYRHMSLTLTSKDGLFKKCKELKDNFNNFDLTVIVNNYNFKNNDYYNAYIKKYGDDSTIFNSYRKDDAFGIIYINYISIGGKVNDKMYSDIYNELSHYFQQLNIGERYHNSNFMVNVNTNLSSEEENTKNISKILYYCDDAEQDSVVNGLYGYVINSEKKSLLKTNNEINNFIKNDTSFKWSVELNKLIEWLKNNNTDSINNIVKNDFNIKSVDFLIKYAERKEKRLNQKITKCIFKIKKDLDLIEGYGIKKESMFCHLPFEEAAINEEYFTPNELLTETKKYYVNMDVKVKEDSRTAPKMTPSELENEFKKVWDKYNTEDQSYRLGRFVYNMLRYDNPSNSPYKILKEFYKDMSKVGVDSENIDTVGNIRTTKSGIPYVLCNKHGDWENPVLFMVYFDGNKVRGYIPEYGNCYNRVEKRAFGDPSDKDDKAFIKSQYPDKTDDEIYTIQNNLHYNKDACIKDFEKHIKVSGKYESKKPNVSESIDIINESLLLEATLDDIYTKYYSNIPQDEFWQIIKADPTYNEQKSQKMGKYGKWLLNLYKQGKLKNEDLYKATDYLSYFVKYYNKIAEKDINKLPDLPSLYNVIKPYKEAFDNGEEIATSKSDEVRRIKEDAEKVFEDNQWLVVVPHTQEASCYYGKNTQWCTAATDSYNMFNQYNNKGPLFINIRKTDGKKFQFHFETNSFMDETDTPIRTPIAKTIGLNADLLQYYISRYGGKATIILTCSNLDLDDIDIDGEDPYYVYNDYDGYYYIVEVKGTQITRCKGLEYDSFTADNDISYLGNSNFKLHNYQEEEYYDSEEDEYYGTGEFETSEEWSIYNAKLGKTITLPESVGDIFKFNNQYIHAKIDNNKNTLIDSNTLKPVFETTDLVQSANYYLQSCGWADDRRKLTSYDDNLIITIDYSAYKENGDSLKQLYNIKQQSYVIPPFKPYTIVSKAGNDGYEYLTFKHTQITNSSIDYCTILPDGSLTQVYQTESIHNSNNLINESYLLEAELKDIYPKYYNDIPQDIFWNIIKTDPTYDEQRSQKMGKYGKWLLNQYRQGNLDINNLPKVKNTIDFFNRYNRQLEVKDINQYKNIDQVYDNVKNYMEDPSQATSKSDEVRKIKEMGAEKVYEDNDWIIIVPKTQEAATYYGKGTKWCTASTGSYNYFERYNNEGNLYININKNTGDKYQFHFESNSFMDAEDKPIKGVIAEEIGLSSGAEQFYASLGEDQEYAISSEEHTDPDEEPEEEEILNQNGWQMIYNNNTGEISIHNDNEDEDCMIFDDGSIEQMDGYPIVEPLHEFLPVFVIEKLQEYYNNETFYKMVLADYDPTDKGFDYYPIGSNGAVFKYYNDINSGVLYRVDEQTYQFAKVIDFISFDLKLKDKISRENIDNLIFLNEYDEQLCYNVNTFTWAFDEPVDKFCFTNAVKATALKNGQGFVKIFKNNTIIQVPSYNNMPINTLDYDDYANVIIVEVLNNGEKAYAVYSVAKNQYVNNKLYASACYMRKKNAIAMISDKSERMTDSKLNLTKQGSDYMMDLYYKYGYIIYYNPDSSDQIIFANGKSVTRKDYFKYEEVYDFLVKIRQQPKLTYF